MYTERLVMTQSGRSRIGALALGFAFRVDAENVFCEVRKDRLLRVHNISVSVAGPFLVVYKPETPFGQGVVSVFRRFRHTGHIVNTAIRNQVFNNRIKRHGYDFLVVAKRELFSS